MRKAPGRERAGDFNEKMGKTPTHSSAIIGVSSNYRGLTFFVVQCMFYFGLASSVRAKGISQGENIPTSMSYSSGEKGREDTRWPCVCQFSFHVAFCKQHFDFALGTTS